MSQQLPSFVSSDDAHFFAFLPWNCSTYLYKPKNSRMGFTIISTMGKSAVYGIQIPPIQQDMTLSLKLILWLHPPTSPRVSVSFSSHFKLYSSSSSIWKIKRKSHDYLWMRRREIQIKLEIKAILLIRLINKYSLIATY